MEHMDSSSDSMPSMLLRPSDKRQLWHDGLSLVWPLNGAAELQSCTQVAHLICAGCHGINTSLSFPTVFAHARVCSAVSLSPIVMSSSPSTFPPCPSAANCPSPSLSLLSASPSSSLPASGLTVHLPTHTGTLGLPSKLNLPVSCRNV